MRYQEEGISRKSKLSLLVMLLALLSTIAVKDYKEYRESKRIIREAEIQEYGYVLENYSSNNVIVGNSLEGGTITLPAMVRPGMEFTIVAAKGEWVVESSQKAGE